MQYMHANIPYMFDCWTDPVVHLLLLKSSMVEQISSTCCGARPNVCVWASKRQKVISQSEDVDDVDNKKVALDIFEAIHSKTSFC